MPREIHKDENGEWVDQNGAAVCGAYSRRNDAPCKSYPVEGSDKCRMHGGTSPGPPENNGRAATHNLRSDRNKLYARADDADQQAIDGLEQSLIDRHEAVLGHAPDRFAKKDLFELAMMAYQEVLAQDYMAEQAEESDHNALVEEFVVGQREDGTPIFGVRESTVWHQLDKTRNTKRQLLKDLGLLDDPETKKANAMGDMANDDYEIVVVDDGDGPDDADPTIE